MKLTNDFTVPAPIDQAWEVMLDVERIAPCLPGASLDGQAGDEYQGTMTVKLGPVTSKYKGTLSIVEADEQAHRAVLKAGARDARGGRASATITSTMEEVSDGTKVVVETDMKITGPAAQFGRGVMQDVSAKLMNQFATCLAAEIIREPATAEAGKGTEEAATVPTGAATNGDGAATAARGGAPAGGEVPTPAPGATGTPEAPLTAAASPGSEPPPGAGPPPRSAPDVLDLGAASREAVLKRAVPAAGALFGLLALLVVLRRLRG